MTTFYCHCNKLITIHCPELIMLVLLQHQTAVSIIRKSTCKYLYYVITAWMSALFVIILCKSSQFQYQRSHVMIFFLALSDLAHVILHINSLLSASFTHIGLFCSFSMVRATIRCVDHSWQDSVGLMVLVE